MAVQIAPFGSWASALSAERLAAANVCFGQLALAGDSIFSSEGGPAEGRRNVIVECDTTGTCRDLSPAPFDARTRVHKYGGGERADPVSRSRRQGGATQPGRDHVPRREGQKPARRLPALRGERHGVRQARHIGRALEAELAFNGASSTSLRPTPSSQ